MDTRLRLVLALHNHQPIGNFDGVCEAAFQDSYLPFLETLAEYPELPIALHTSGSLLEWLESAHPEYIDRVRMLADRGQIEILGGPYYEPILACIPARDRTGQILAYTSHLERTFGTRVRGMWVPERVWEQSFTRDICRAGMEYSILDDHHFRSAGLEDHQLFSYFLTEDEGHLLKLFPGSEKLRYTIPFAEPHETIDYLREVAGQRPGGVVVFGDDGEKFGTWPGTKDHVYAGGWLRRFFDALMDNRDWLKLTTLGEAVDQVAPEGRHYVPDSSYREMTEWALPTDRQTELKHLNASLEHHHDFPRLKRFMRGGFWRNFLVKYPEANAMYTRMLEVSGRIDTLGRECPREEWPAQLAEAQKELYRGQCNCPYWHGAFGGLYLPHLRNAIYTHLIAADNLLEAAAQRPSRWVEVSVADYNLDARQEIRLASDRLVAYLSPAEGGHLYELDLRTIRHNLLATLDRRPEPYHDTIRAAGAASGDEHHDGDHVASIHDAVRFKQPDLDQKIVYDQWHRKSLVDHFLQPGLTLEEFRRIGGEMGDFTSGVYDTHIRRSDDLAGLRMSRTGTVGPYNPRVTKTVSLSSQRSGCLVIEYELEQLPPGVPVHFGVEFNFAGMAAGANDRYYYDSDGRQLGQLGTDQELPACERLGLIDEWLGLDTAIESSIPACIWAMPIETISQSEGGFELVHQSCAVLPHWEIVADDSGRWSVTLRLLVDTSAAQARQLSEMAVTA